MVMEVFSRAAVPQRRVRGIELKDAVLNERPDLIGQKSDQIGGGTQAHTIYVGDEIFKSPLNSVFDEKTNTTVYDVDRAIAEFNAEVKILQQLQGKGLPIPVITHIGKHTVFYGMKKIKGPLMGTDFEKMYSEAEQKVVAADIINFVVSMANELPLKDGAFASHDDLNCHNIILNPVTRRVAGIIDFGNIAYCSTDTKKENGWFVRGGYEPAFRIMLEAEFDRRKHEITGAPVAPRPANNPAPNSP